MRRAAVTSPPRATFAIARFHLQRRDAVLARFDDGGVALAERRVGQGRVLVFASTFDGYWNDLPVQPVFLPLVQSLVRHAAGWTPEPPWQTVGQVLALFDASASSRAATAAVAPSGARTRWTGDDSVRSLPLARARVLRDSRGRRRGAESHRRGESSTRPNRSSAHSRLTSSRAPSRRLARLERRRPARRRSPSPSASGGRLLWWYVLVAALVLLAVESLLSNRLSRSARPDLIAAERRIEHA